MMRPEGMAIDNENGNQGVQNVPSFSQRESEGKQQQQQEPLIQPIRGTNKQLQRQQQLLAQKQLQQQQHEHQQQQQQQQLLSNYRQEQEQQPPLPPLQPLQQSQQPQQQLPPPPPPQQLLQQQKLLQQPPQTTNNYNQQQPQPQPQPQPQQQLPQQYNILQQQIQKYRQQLQLQPSQPQPYQLQSSQLQPYQLQPSQLQQITKEDLARVLSHFDSVLTRHGNNPIDPVWKKAKDFMTIAFMDYLSESPVGRIVAPPFLSPFFSQSLPSILPHPASLPSSSLSSPSPPPPQFTSNVSWRPPSESIVEICQARNFVLSLFGIPRAGDLILSIINVNGIMRGEDVTYNFTRCRRARNSGEKGTVRWDIKPENATSKIPHSTRGLNSMDRNAFHMIRIRFVEDGRTDEQGEDLEFEDKYIVVKGRGTSESKDISKKMEIEWGRLMNRTRVEERRGISKRKREDDNKDGSKEKDEGSEEERCKRTRKDEGKIDTNDIRKDMGQYMMADCKTLNAEPCHPSSPSALPPSSTISDSEKEMDTDKEPLETFILIRDSPRPPIVPPSSHPLPLPTSSSQPPSLPPSSQPPPPLTTFSKEPLHLSIRLIDIKSKQPIAWGTMVEDDDEMCIAIHNPDSVNTTRVVCQVTDSKENALPIQGDRVKDIRPKESVVMCKFTASKKHRPMQLHFLAANLPLVPGRPLFHTRLFLNVK